MAALAGFLALRRSERHLTVEAAFWLLLVRLAIGVLPFRSALRLLRIAPGEAAGGRIDASEAAAIGRAVERAARHVPFHAVCLQQAFAAALMLRRRGLAAAVHLGVAREAPEADLTAHAWSRCGDSPVTGEAAAADFTAVAAFVG